jgi:uncharacterized protein YndB with AHSA1/START domain
MTARFERFDPTPGGSYRLILTYADPTDSGAKRSANSDVVEARYVEIVQDDRVVHTVVCVSDDPAFSGTMTMKWAEPNWTAGTLVDFIADDVPAGISAEDHTAGMAAWLAGSLRLQPPFVSALTASDSANRDCGPSRSGFLHRRVGR